MKEIRIGDLVLIVVCDAITANETVDRAIRSIGGRKALPRSFTPCAYYCIGIRGLPPGCAFEKYVEGDELSYPSYR